MADKTLSFYGINTAEYVAQSETNPRLSSIMARFKPGGKVLELGSGSGLDARGLISAGFDVDATDGSAGLAAAAEKIIGKPVRIMMFNDLAAHQDYDAIYANASLLHVPRTELPNIIRRVHAALKDNGVVWASFKAGHADGLDSLGRYYNYLSANELVDYWTEAASWKSVELESWQGRGFDRRPTEWLAVTAIC